MQQDDIALNADAINAAAVDVTAQDGDLCPPLLRLVGDATLDIRVDSQDLVRVFQAGKYETGERAAWDEGDFDGNGLFDSSDLIAVLQSGNFGRDPSEFVPPDAPVACHDFGENAELVLTEEGSRRARHRIERADGGWTDEYTDYDKDGKRIGSTSETYDKNGIMREKTTTRFNDDGGRTTTTETYDKDAKWTGTTTETYDKDGKQTGGTKTAPDGKGGTTTQTYDPATGTWK
jgi:hypothetical protein